MTSRWFVVVLLLCPMVPEVAGADGPHAEDADSLSTLVWQDLDRALLEGREKSRVTLVFVHAKGCGPCRLMETKVLPQVRPVLQQLTLAKLDFDDRSTRLSVDDLVLTPFAWARRFGVEATPGFVLIDPDGKPVLREKGLLDAKAFGLFLAYGSTGAYRHGSFAEYIDAMRGPGGEAAGGL